MILETSRLAEKIGRWRRIGGPFYAAKGALVLLAWFFSALVSGCGPQLQPLMGMPLPGLSDNEMEQFDAGHVAFTKQFVKEEGLGPLFNDFGCADCHNFPVAGGFSHRTNTRFGRAGTPFEALTDQGGTVFQFQFTVPSCEEFLPREADVFAKRGTTHLFGSGLVEAVADETLVQLQSGKGHVAGRVNWVIPLGGGAKRAGRFGWKSQLATLLDFSADAALEELGLTNRLMPNENAPNGDRSKIAAGDFMADPEDRPDDEGLSMIDRFTHFQRYLAPPPQTPRSGMVGERFFNQVGCAECHVPELTTGEHEISALSRKRFKPYSDFLVHDMGSLGDGIAEGQATERMMRTAPLWGLAARGALLHDLMSTGGSFAENLISAVSRHAGDAQWSRDQFLALEENDRADLIDFLHSLGRAEFDWDRDYDVDGDDLNAFLRALSNDQDVVEADDAEAVFDVDQNGRLDFTDFGALLRAIRQSRAAKGDL
ncbi:MAG: hypothetical protein ACI8TQ_000965 [Planctomycetota bacterium]|jgi:hypothetical protein